MFYVPKHAQPKQPSAARRRGAGLAAAGIAAGVVPVATAGSASASTTSGTVWDRVAACESGGRWSINTGNGYYGGLQFHSQTWTGHGGGHFARYAHQATRLQQIHIAKKVLMSQGPGAWPVCSKRAGLTRANGLAVPTTGTGTSAASRTATRTSPTGAGSIAVDGVWGAATNRKIEYVVASSNVNARIDGWESHRVQKKLGLAQHTSTVKSSAFAAHIQRKYGLTVTGTWNTATVKAFQKNLNYAR